MVAFLSIGSAVSILATLVWPKIARAVNGEAVVMSKLLDSRFSMTTSSEHVAAAGVLKQQIAASKDTVPPQMEQNILAIQNVLRDVNRKV